MSYFPEPCTHSRKRIKVELNVHNYATELDLKRATGVDSSKFVKKTDLANLKSDIIN